ncbi:MAG: MBOAT family protein [Bacteroidales bacterium]|nr:MBOAT family protein [Bacteroidales bacterium]
MLFNSFEFLLFFPAVVVLFYLTPHRWRWLMVSLSSAFFMAFARLDFVLVILSIIMVNYLSAILMERSAGCYGKKWALAASLILDIGLLSYFKYFNFLADNFNSLFDLLGLNLDIPHLSVVLPLGISFYTFQAIGYNIEVYRGSMKAERNLPLFLTYLLFFPKLIAGPIERAQNFLPQLHSRISLNFHNINSGIKLMIWGFFKKLVVADRIDIYVNAVYGNIEQHSSITLFTASVLFAFQIYADFSGYTDIARGVARVMGFRLMENFERPFLALSVSEFWRRWHISLSSWADDYIFKPIVAQKRYWGNWGVLYGVIITFFVIGIWHGPSWNFVLFGLFQAVVIFYELLTKKSRKRFRKKLTSPLIKGLHNHSTRILTFLFITFSMVFFKAPTFDDAMMILSRVATFETGTLFLGSLSTFVFAWSGIVFLVLAEIRREYGWFDFGFLSNKYMLVRLLKYSLLVLIILMIGVFDGGQFIYFQF